jgi:NAD(P)-dependent dehydrogenase (short-subunit alcohol dehydrogenase family)
MTRQARVMGKRSVKSWEVKSDVLVNNAGIMPIAPLALLKIDEWERMIDINIKGLLYGVAAALPHFTLSHFLLGSADLYFGAAPPTPNFNDSRGFRQVDFFSYLQDDGRCCRNSP